MLHFLNALLRPDLPIAQVTITNPYNPKDSFDVPIADGWHHRFRMHDRDRDHTLSDHLEIHTVELPRWRLPDRDLDDASRWMYLLKEGRNWTELPADLDTPEMNEAMAILQRFTKDQQERDLYRNRMQAIRERASFEQELAEARQELAEARQRADEVVAERDEAAARAAAVVAERDEAAARAARLERLLREAGIDLED